jgi:hypothetical protein
VAGEEEVVLGGDGEGVAHERGRVDGQGGGHVAGDAVSCELRAEMGWDRWARRGETMYTTGLADVSPSGGRTLLVAVTHPSRTFQGPFACPSQPPRGYRSWRPAPRSLEMRETPAISHSFVSGYHRGHFRMVSPASCWPETAMHRRHG